MKAKSILCAAMLLGALTMSAQSNYDLHFYGYVNHKYPVVVDLNYSASDGLEGRYAYESTLSKLGNDDPKAYLYLYSLNKEATQFSAYDDNTNVVESWKDVTIQREKGRLVLKADIETAKGKTFTLQASTSAMPTDDARFAGTYAISGKMGRRNSSVMVDLVPCRENAFVGRIKVNVGDQGFLTGVVNATLSGNNLTLYISRYDLPTDVPVNILTDRQFPRLTPGDAIFQITENNDSYHATPLGNMNVFIQDPTTIHINK